MKTESCRSVWFHLSVHTASDGAPVDLASEICDRLNTEGGPFAEIARMRNEIRRLTIERTNPTNTSLQQDERDIAELLEGREPSDSLFATIESVRKSAECLATGVEAKLGIDYVRALIGVAVYEAAGLSSTDTGSEDEDA